MKMITPNKKAKKGFSLVEMLVVIAIIAILVSIIIPVVHHNTVKAAAATNAANLRAIEGKLKIMRLDTPEDFKNYLDMFKDGTLSQLKNDLGTVFDFLFGTGWTEAQLSENFGKKTADNGVLTLEETNVQITGVPTAKKLKVRGTKKFDTVNIEEGTQMSVYITPDTIRAVYIGEDGSVYGVEHFADIAENGKLTNTQIGQTGGSQESGFICDTWGHDIGPDGKCQRTGCTFDSGYHTCIDVKKVIREPLTGAALYTTDGQDDECDICGIDMNHPCEDNEPKDHRCDAGCGAILSECDDTVDNEEGHCCSICGKKQSDHDWSGDRCTVCGKSKHEVEGHTDPDQDHFCACGYQINSCDDFEPDYDFANHYDCSYCKANPENHNTDGISATHHNLCSECGYNGKSVEHDFNKTETNHTCKHCTMPAELTTHTWTKQDGTYHVCTVCKQTQKHQMKNNACTINGCDHEEYCVTADTLVTLADGSKKRIDEVSYADELIAWDFYTGKATVVPVAAIINHGDNEYRICKLMFEDGTVVKIIQKHGFFDVTENKYIFLDENNVADYIGHEFAKVDTEGISSVKLVAYEITVEYSGCYSILSAVYNSCMVEGLLSLTPLPIQNVQAFFDCLKVGSDMKYDEAALNAAIEKHGLYTYEELSEYFTYEQFIALNAPYLKIMVGEGTVEFEEIIAIVSNYIPQ